MSRGGRVRSVILLSGGLDSAANLAFCSRWDDPVLALTFRYGQQAADREVNAAADLCRHYGTRHEVVEIPWLGVLGGSSLTDSSQALPELRTDELDDSRVTRESAKSVWVPNRNGVLLNIAAAFAERLGAERVVVGFNREEAATFPDNTIEFLNRTTTALAMSTSNGVKAFSYTGDLDKREIVAKLREEDPRFPYERVWSCYRGGERPCESCESCRRFARATRPAASGLQATGESG